MTRKELLEKALKTVSEERKDQYGKPENNFEIIAELWSAYMRGKPLVGEDFTAEDVAVMMILLKVARISSGTSKADNWIDIAGYAACGAEVSESGEEK